jgi:hypothetical protein
METPNTKSLSASWTGLGVKQQDLLQVFRSFNAYAEPFRRESEQHEE